MSNPKYFVLILTVFYFSCSSQSKLERVAKTEKQYLKTKELIESGKFEYEARFAFPLDLDAVRIASQLPGAAGTFQGNSVNLIGNPNYVKINGNQTDLSMPFFGRAFNANFYGGQGSGIEFEGELSDYKVNYNDKKQRINISFNTNKPNDFMQFSFEIGANGDASLNVTGNNRQNIRYEGNIFELKEGKKE